MLNSGDSSHTERLITIEDMGKLGILRISGREQNDDIDLHRGIWPTRSEWAICRIGHAELSSRLVDELPA
jgi:hypothetical protein